LSDEDDHSIVQEFTVDEPLISLIEGAGSAEQRKSNGSGTPNNACAMCNSATFRLDLVFEIDGETVGVSGSGDFSCAY
jgi:hypothetical protein